MAMIRYRRGGAADGSGRGGATIRPQTPIAPGISIPCASGRIRLKTSTSTTRARRSSACAICLNGTRASTELLSVLALRLNALAAPDAHQPLPVVRALLSLDGPLCGVGGRGVEEPPTAASATPTLEQ